jgi:hypothetical protein
MSDVDFRMTYPCYFLCGESGGLVCITVDCATCLCLFTNAEALRNFQQEYQKQPPSNSPFALEVACAACHNYDELISRLNTAEIELADSDIRHLALNPQPNAPVLYATIREFVERLPRP